VKPAAFIFRVEEYWIFWRNLEFLPFGKTNPECGGSRLL
jgi:hypothetical protein